MKNRKNEGPGKQVILIIEDDSTNMLLFNDILTASGYSTLKANDGKEGIEIAERERPDLILMDRNMPIMNGLEALHVLKSRDSTKSIPVVALTAHGMPEDEKEMLKAGFNEYITKPIDLGSFLKTIEICLMESKAEAPR
jgi:two-component system, cell cycle response regulator DivK